MPFEASRKNRDPNIGSYNHTNVAIITQFAKSSPRKFK